MKEETKEEQDTAKNGSPDKQEERKERIEVSSAAEEKAVGESMDPIDIELKND